MTFGDILVYFQKNGIDVELVSAVTYKIVQQKFTSSRKLLFLLCA